MNRKSFLMITASALLVSGLVAASIAVASDDEAIPARPEGPGDIYAAAGMPCAAAHSSTRALYKDYDGPLYQVMRQSDGKTLDIGVVRPSAGDAGGYADAAAQDDFCADTYCWVTILYDQSGHGNDLYQAPRGGFSGPAMGGFNNVPVADWAPVTIMEHQVYGIQITPGMGMRWNDAHGTAVDDQAEGQYWVISGHHYNGGCCFDYGNAETDSRDDGDGTMETTYFGNGQAWYRGQAPGPWVMTDQENNLVGCVNPDPSDKFCADLPSITWRFVTAMADGEPHHWRTMAGNAKEDSLIIMYDGGRIINPQSSYDPMRKQGAILLGNGGDNSNGSSGTFYEAAMTGADYFPSEETNQAVQANIVAARYSAASLSIGDSRHPNAPTGLQTFAPRTSAHTTVTFTNTGDEPIEDLCISLVTPRRWKSVVSGSRDRVRKIGYSVAPGQTVIVNFTVTSSRRQINADLKAEAVWTGSKGRQVRTAIEKVRNVPAVKVNEFRASDGTNKTNSFIELYNAGERKVNISGWELTQHAANLPYFSSIKIPAGTKLEAKSFYLLGISNSGLSVRAAKGDDTIFVRSLEGMSVGDEIVIGTGRDAETRTIASIGSPAPEAPVQEGMRPRRQSAAGTPTTIWQPLPEGPVITVPAGSTNIPVTSTDHFKTGQKMAIGYGSTYPAVSNSLEKYEVVTITSVGKPGTQAYLSMDAKKGDTFIKVSSTENITAGDKIRLDIDSKGHGIETVTVKSVGTPSVRNTFRGPLEDEEDPGTGLELAAPLQFDHSSNIPFSVNGTGITFEPASAFEHSSNEPVLALVYSITLDKSLGKTHEIDDVVLDAKVSTAGYHDSIEADLLFGGPVLDESRGNITLRTSKGLIADALNYGGVVDPWLSEGYQSEPDSPGNFASAPASSRNRRWNPFAQVSSVAGPDLSSGRFPDGTDSDSNADDFRVQTNLTLSAPSKPGESKLIVSTVNGLAIGQYIYVGKQAERVQIATIGTAGGAKITEPAVAGSTKISVGMGMARAFAPGQKMMIGDENVTIASIQFAERFRGQMAPGMKMPEDVIVLSQALKSAVAAGDYLTGTGITLAAPLTSGHTEGEAVCSSGPTPGMPNRF